MSLNIQNILGNIQDNLRSKVEEYFGNKQNPVPVALAALNELIGFPYCLEIDWREW
jgi:hypothetical protein